MRHLLLFAALLPLVAVGQVNECSEQFLECREDCSLEHSSIRADAPKKLNKCIKKCQKKLTTCEERELETKSNSLEAGALDKSPVSSDVDEQGMPTRTAVKKAKTSDDEVRRSSPGDDLRDDRPAPAPAPVEEKKPSKKAKPEEAEERRPPREEVRESEIPKSSRTELKVAEPTKKDEPKKPEPEPTRRAEPDAIVMTPKAEAKKPAEDELRDDRPRASEPPTKKAEKKKDDLPPPPPKPKEEDHDDLRNF
ncbi:MAG: hypothetical protein JNJ54_24075 [Myxococcaceae bacterium]|nr:hypothetical protein [Myxococcaceae bacterium]